jgi:hypothetical protein
MRSVPSGVFRCVFRLPARTPCSTLLTALRVVLTKTVVRNWTSTIPWNLQDLAVCLVSGEHTTHPTGNHNFTEDIFKTPSSIICSTQMSAFDVPRVQRVKLHVPLGYWIKLRNPCSQSAKYTHTHFLWPLDCHRKQHTLRDFLKFYFVQTIFAYSAHRKVVQRNAFGYIFDLCPSLYEICITYALGACVLRV